MFRQGYWTITHLKELEVLDFLNAQNKDHQMDGVSLLIINFKEKIL